MKCLACGSDNKENAKFCRGCGSSLNTPEPVAAVTTVPCLSCGQANVPGKKFCSKCGASMAVQAPLPVDLPQRTEIKVAPEVYVEEFNLCPKCNNNLKPAAKFCGKCGFNFEQKNTDESTKAASKPIEVAAIVQLPSQAVSVAKEAISPPQANTIKAAQATKLVEHAKPDASQQVFLKDATPPPTPEKAKQQPSGQVAVIGVLLACAIGGGAYWWFSTKQAPPPPAADMGNMQAPADTASTASAAVAASEPDAAPVAAEAAPLAPAPLPTIQPVPPVALAVIPPASKPEAPPVAQPEIPPQSKPAPLPKPTEQPVQEKPHENKKIIKLLEDARKYIAQGNYKQAEESMKFCEMIEEGNQDCQRMKQKAAQLNDKMFDCVSAGKEWVGERCN